MKTQDIEDEDPSSCEIVDEYMAMKSSKASHRSIVQDISKKFLLAERQAENYVNALDDDLIE